MIMITPAVAVVLCVGGSSRAVADSTAVACRPGILYVKYADPVDDSAQRILSNGGFTSFFANAAPDEATGVKPGSLLDEIHSDIQLEEIECVYVDRASSTATAAKEVQAANIESLLGRYPERSARRDPEAVFPDRTNI